LLSSAAPPLARNAPKPTATSWTARTSRSRRPPSTAATERYANTYAQKETSSAASATPNQYDEGGRIRAMTPLQPAIVLITASATANPAAAMAVVTASGRR